MELLKIKNVSTGSKMVVDLPEGKACLQIEEKTDENAVVRIETQYHGIYGLGEKFDSVNQKGKTVVNMVRERFCNQGDYTYCSIPFFMTDTGLGILTECKKASEFCFNQGDIILSVPTNAELLIWTGSPKDILQGLHEYMGGEMETPPKFAFGPWISANHWNCQEDLEEAAANLRKYDFPATVIVAEAWSDEATFYIFNGAEYKPKTNGEVVKYEDFDFSHSCYWHDPKGMIERLAQEGLNLVLWQIPVFKCMEKEYIEVTDPKEKLAYEQNRLDAEYAREHGLSVRSLEGAEYHIPKGNWFEGSTIPDWTNPQTKDFWFGKRRYLLDIGIKGFKTDGGEFIYSDSALFHNGDTGAEQKNAYSQGYVDSYREFVGSRNILFSRAGYTGAQRTPFLWAGDHMSTNDELKHAYYAAISAACSGILYWGYDIGGFAGALPTEDLYLRSTAFACFCPIMQWHSEPDGGQFKDILAGVDGNNERSPWNLDKIYHDPDFLEKTRYWHKLRMRLLPYIYKQADISAKTGIPMMRPVFWDCFEDGELLYHEDEYYFGEELLVAPLLEENATSRQVYLPKGKWEGFFSHTEYIGGTTVSSEEEKYPVFIREGHEIEMNK